MVWPSSHSYSYSQANRQTQYTLNQKLYLNIYPAGGTGISPKKTSNPSKHAHPLKGRLFCPRQQTFLLLWLSPHAGPKLTPSARELLPPQHSRPECSFLPGVILYVALADQLIPDSVFFYRFNVLLLSLFIPHLPPAISARCRLIPGIISLPAAPISSYAARIGPVSHMLAHIDTQAH